VTPLEVARTQVGITEPIAYDRYTDGERLPWCAAFVLWCYRQSTGPELPGNRWRNRAVWRLQRELERVGARVIGPPDVGDLVVSTRVGSEVTPDDLLAAGSPGHIGIIDELYASCWCIEGNVGDEVMRVEYAMPPRTWLRVYRWP